MINSSDQSVILDSNIIELIQGAEVWHPDFWSKSYLNIETSLDLDSAGMYELNTPFTGDLSSTYTRY